MHGKKNEAAGLLIELLSAVLYCGVFFALVLIIVR